MIPTGIEGTLMDLMPNSISLILHLRGIVRIMTFSDD